MAKRHSAEQWEPWISEQQKSALSVRDFCDWVGVSENAFYLWRGGLCRAVSHNIWDFSA